MSGGAWTLGPAHPSYGLPLPAPAEPQLPAGSWSRQHVACLGHGGTDVPHHGHGLCLRCYSSRLRELERAEDLEYRT